MKKSVLLVITGLIMVLTHSQQVLSNNSPTRDLTIAIQPQFNKQPLILSSQSYISDAGDTLRIDRFRFYLSSIHLVFENGTTYNENESYHLVDAESESSLQLTLKNVPEGKIREIQFNIGVDSLKCTSGVFGGDLDPSNGMYWAWNSGYIHAKLEGSSTSCKTHRNAFEFHIGGFSSPYNAVRTVVIGVNQDTDTLILAADAHDWIKNISLTTINSIVIPGDQSMKIGDNYKNMFRLLPE